MEHFNCRCGTTFDWAHPDGDYTAMHIVGHIKANRILIPPDAQINTSIYEEAEVVDE